MSSGALLEELRRAAPEFGLDLTAETVRRFAKHFELLVQWNRRVNLTRITDPAEAALFSVPASGGAPTRLHAGAPLGYITGLVLGCDGQTLAVAH